MKYSLLTTDALKKSTDCLIVGIWAGRKLTEAASELDAISSGMVNKLLRSGDMSGKCGETLFQHEVAGSKARRLLLVGCGEQKEFNAKACRKALQAAVQAVRRSGSKDAVLTLPALEVVDREGSWSTTQAVIEFESASYAYQRTRSKPAEQAALKTVFISGADASGSDKDAKSAARSANREATEAIRFGESIGRAINTARELGNLPGNICTPTYLADEALKLGKQHSSLKVQALNEKQMQKLGMGSLLSVSAGSVQEARLIVIEYSGAKKASASPYVLVGKGITFDTGGTSLKPGLNMDEMKYDMCGAASVLATLSAVAELKLPINVVGVIPAAENMPSGVATKPGDVVTSMAGLTIEILNTDAEGRLVLCDALTYVERFKPQAVIDVATLTGAAVATFGDYTSALLGNNDELAAELLNAGETMLDHAWRLPMADEYQKLLDSNFADIANIGGPKAGTITAACFLSRFTKAYRWAHLDIAGTAWRSGPQKGATGRPVALLVEYLRRQSGAA